MKNITLIIFTIFFSLFSNSWSRNFGIQLNLGIVYPPEIGSAALESPEFDTQVTYMINAGTWFSIGKIKNLSLEIDFRQYSRMQNLNDDSELWTNSIFDVSLNHKIQILWPVLLMYYGFGMGYDYGYIEIVEDKIDCYGAWCTPETYVKGDRINFGITTQAFKLGLIYKLIDKVHYPFVKIGINGNLQMYMTDTILPPNKFLELIVSIGYLI